MDPHHGQGIDTKLIKWKANRPQKRIRGISTIVTRRPCTRLGCHPFRSLAAPLCTDCDAGEIKQVKQGAMLLDV